MKIDIKTIPHKDQRYPTVGDWWFDDETKTLNIRVSDMGDVEMEYLVIDHELREAMICNHRGISEKAISNFDILFEKIRAENPEIIGDMEPGDMIGAPYHMAHKFATDVEKVTAAQLEVDWDKYSEKVNSL